MLVPILHANISNFVLSAFTMHDQAVPPVPPLIGIPGVIEGLVSMGYPPGMIAHKTAFTVFTDGDFTVQHNHDVGYLQPHIQMPPNSLSVVHMAFSKHKVMFPVSTVNVGGSPAGTYCPVFLGQVCCNPVGLPAGVVILFKCTVWSSMTWMSFLKGVLNIALDVAIDALWNRLFKGVWFSRTPQPANAVLRLPLQGNNFSVVLSGYSLREIFSDPGAMRVAASWIRRMIFRNKLVDHVLKSWLATPFVFNLAKGEWGLGRGRASVKFFDGDWF